MGTMHRDTRVVLILVVVFVAALLVPSSFGQSNTPVSADKAMKPGLPRMVDLGRNQCLPCKMMAPVLKELKQQYAGVIEIEFINIAENPGVMEKLGLPVRAVPFQIFYDAAGKIVRRHYGYMSKEEILQAFRELGFDRRKTEAKPG